MLHDLERALLQQSLDGTLPDERRDDVTRLLASNAEARRYVAEHRYLWEALEDALAPSTEVDHAPGDFVARTVAAASRDEPPRVRWRWMAAIAAAAAVLMTVSTWLHTDSSPLHDIPTADRDVVRYLHVLRNLDLLEAHGSELDLRTDFEVYRAFAGEMEGEG